jgi:hypothetical protein
MAAENAAKKKENENMKRIIDYKKEWEQLVYKTAVINDPHIVPMEPYVVMHFLEDIGAPEPWKAADQEKIEKAVSELPEQEQIEFMRLFSEVEKMTES